MILRTYDSGKSSWIVSGKYRVNWYGWRGEVFAEWLMRHQGQRGFATVRLRMTKTKGSGCRSACLTMVFKLMESASKKWRLLNGSPLLMKVIAGVRFVDGVEQTNAA